MNDKTPRSAAPQSSSMCKTDVWQLRRRCETSLRPFPRFGIRIWRQRNKAGDPVKQNYTRVWQGWGSLAAQNVNRRTPALSGPPTLPSKPAIPGGAVEKHPSLSHLLNHSGGRGCHRMAYMRKMAGGRGRYARLGEGQVGTIHMSKMGTTLTKTNTSYLA